MNPVIFWIIQVHGQLCITTWTASNAHNKSFNLAKRIEFTGIHHCDRCWLTWQRNVQQDAYYDEVHAHMLHVVQLAWIWMKFWCISYRSYLIWYAIRHGPWLRTLRSQSVHMVSALFNSPGRLCVLCILCVWALCGRAMRRACVSVPPHVVPNYRKNIPKHWTHRTNVGFQFCCLSDSSAAVAQLECTTIRMIHCHWY